MLVVVLCAALAAAAPPAGAPPTSDAALARLAEGAAQARFRYLEGDFDGAIAAADAVDAAFLGATAAGCTPASHPEGCPLDGLAFSDVGAAWDAWSDAQATRGLALQRQQDDAAMDATFRALLTVRPAWMPDRGFVPPKQLQRFESLRQALLSTPMVPLTLTVEGPGDPVLDGRVVARGAPIDVIPGRHFVGVGGVGRAVVVAGPTTLALGTPGPAMGGGSTTPTPPPGGTVEDGPPWGLIAGGAVGLVVVGAVVVGALVVLNQPEPAENPGGTTVFVDASKLNPVDP
jgi:hypothetical protein